MRKHILCFFLLLGIASNIPLHADSFKIINLKDGSTIKGQVTKLKNNVYTIITPSMGEIKVNDSAIESIGSPAAQSPSTFQINPSSHSSDNNSPFSNQLQQMQGSILTDPHLMADIQNLLNDPEILKIISDEKFKNDVMSQDVNRIEQNDRTQDLMNNPKIQALIEKINSKFSQQK